MNETANQTIPNRSQRRMAMKYQGLLKMKGKLPLNEWSDVCKQTREKGKEIHEANVEAVDKSIYAQYEAIENKKISQWKEEGYTKKEIDELREAHASIMIKDKESWHRDKRIARNTIKELRSKLTKRS